MKKPLLPFLVCAASLFAAEQGAPGVIRWTGEKNETRVVETGRLEIFARNPPIKPGSATFADRVADRARRFLWTPSPDPRRGAGGARIPDAALSADGSALLLLETVGADDGPFDTRLVVVDVRTGEIVRVTRFAGARYCRLLILPESGELLLFSAPEGNRQTVVRADAAAGTIRAKTALPAVSDAVIHEGKLLLKDRDAPRLTRRSTETLDADAVFKTAAPGGFLLPESPDAVCNPVPGDPAKIERIALDGRSIQPEERFLVPPPNTRPASGLTLDGDVPTQLYITPDGPAALRIGSRLHPLGERVAGPAAYHRESGTLFLGLRKNDAVAEFRPGKSVAMLRSSPTGQRAPRTRGEPCRYFCDGSQIPSVLILDHRANFYRMQTPTKGRLWKKTLIFTPGE